MLFTYHLAGPISTLFLKLFIQLLLNKIKIKELILLIKILFLNNIKKIIKNGIGMLFRSCFLFRIDSKITLNLIHIKNINKIKSLNIFLDSILIPGVPSLNLNGPHKTLFIVKLVNYSLELQLPSHKCFLLSKIHLNLNFNVLSVLWDKFKNFYKLH